MAQPPRLRSQDQRPEHTGPSEPRRLGSCCLSLALGAVWARLGDRSVLGRGVVDGIWPVIGVFPLRKEEFLMDTRRARG